jgi:hypothetical protein
VHQGLFQVSQGGFKRHPLMHSNLLILPVLTKCMLLFPFLNNMLSSLTMMLLPFKSWWKEFMNFALRDQPSCQCIDSILEPAFWESEHCQCIPVHETNHKIASKSGPFPAGLPSSVVSSVLRVGSRQLSPVRSQSTI